MAIAGIPNPGGWPYPPEPEQQPAEVERALLSSLARPVEWTAQADHPGLEKLVRQMMVATGAGGAAVALRSEHAIVCRATAGNAPKLGVELVAGAGLSGRCLDSGETVLCRDTEKDSSVNLEACRALGLRAALLVPVKRMGTVEGVLEVFSSTADIFDAGDVAALQRMAEEAARFLPEPPPVEEPATQAVPAEAAPTLEAIAIEERSAAPEKAGVEDPVETRAAEPRPVVSASLGLGWPNTVLRLVDDPNCKRWHRRVYWSAVATRKLLGLATLLVPASFLLYFLVGPVIRPSAVTNTTLFRWIGEIVTPGMGMADDFFSFRAVVRGWNLMFLIMAAITMTARSMLLWPVGWALRKVEELTRPRKQYAYVPYVPHRTEFH